MPDEQEATDATHAPSVEDQELDADLQAYDNKEAFYDPEATPLYSLRICSLTLQDNPDILKIEVMGSDLFRAIQEGWLALSKSQPSIEAKLIEVFEAADWDEARQKLIADPQFRQQMEDAYWFFIRNFPKLMVSLYDITLLMSVIFPLQKLFATTGSGSFDRAVRDLLKRQLKAVQNDMKRMLRTRSSGRPKKVTTEAFPEIVQKVLDIAHEMMGDSRGKEAVPGLKGIAARLGLQENALGKQLTRAGYPWTYIKTHLENLPKIENELAADDKNPD